MTGADPTVVVLLALAAAMFQAFNYLAGLAVVERLEQDSRIALITSQWSAEFDFWAICFWPLTALYLRRRIRHVRA